MQTITETKNIHAFYSRQQIFLFLKLCAFLDLGTKKVEAMRCNNTRLSLTYGNINFFPRSGNERVVKECDWTFRLPTKKEFIMVVRFDYLSAYEDQDDIILPDGKIFSSVSLQSI